VLRVRAAAPARSAGPGPAAASGPTRLLALAAGDPRTASAANLRAFLGLVLLHLAAERAGNALAYGLAPGAPAGWLAYALAIAAAAGAALVLAVATERLRTAAAVGFAAQLAFAAVAFPNSANHDALLLMVLAVLWGFDPRRPAERELALSVCRWIAAIVLFATGLQKLLYGTYFHGEYLAVGIAHSDTFAAVFQYLLPGDEFLRLRGLGHDPSTLGLSLFAGSKAGALPAPGSGPYRVESWLVLLFSNGTWIFEMTAPFLLIWRRTRRAAALAAIAFLAFVELAAREWFFGLLFGSLLLLFLPGERHRRGLVLFAIAYPLLMLRPLLLVGGWRPW